MMEAEFCTIHCALRNPGLSLCHLGAQIRADRESVAAATGMMASVVQCRIIPVTITERNPQ